MSSDSKTVISQLTLDLPKKEEENYKSGGIAIWRVSRRTNGIEFLMGIEGHGQCLSFFGGRRDDTDKNARHTAMREFYEETGRVLDTLTLDIIEQLLVSHANRRVLRHKKSVLYICNFDMSGIDICRKFARKIARHKPRHTEMMSLHWISFQALQQVCQEFKKLPDAHKSAPSEWPQISIPNSKYSFRLRGFAQEILCHESQNSLFSFLSELQSNSIANIRHGSLCLMSVGHSDPCAFKALAKHSDPMHSQQNNETSLQNNALNSARNASNAASAASAESAASAASDGHEEKTGNTEEDVLMPPPPAATHGFVWEWLNNMKSHEWMRYEPNYSAEIELYHAQQNQKNGSMFEMDVRGATYIIDFIQMCQVNIVTQSKRPIRRVAAISPALDNIDTEAKMRSNSSKMDKNHKSDQNTHQMDKLGQLHETNEMGDVDVNGAAGSGVNEDDSKQQQGVGSNCNFDANESEEHSMVWQFYSNTRHTWRNFNKTDNDKLEWARLQNIGSVTLDVDHKRYLVSLTGMTQQNVRTRRTREVRMVPVHAPLGAKKKNTEQSDQSDEQKIGQKEKCSKCSKGGMPLKWQWQRRSGWQDFSELESKQIERARRNGCDQTFVCNQRKGVCYEIRVRRLIQKNLKTHKTRYIRVVPCTMPSLE